MIMVNDFDNCKSDSDDDNDNNDGDESETDDDDDDDNINDNHYFCKMTNWNQGSRLVKSMRKGQSQVWRPR